MYMKFLLTGKVPSIADSSSPVVAVGKHLCGCATGTILMALS